MDERQKQFFLDRLAMARKRAQVTQIDMARALGLSAPWLSQLERGHRPWRYAWYVAYCERCGIPPFPEDQCPMTFLSLAKGRPRQQGETRVEQVIVPLTPSEKNNLRELSRFNGTGMAETMRELLKDAVRLLRECQ